MLEDDAEFFEGELRYVYIERAELVEDNAKLTYKTGEQVDVSGLQIRCYYSDGTQELIPAAQAIFWNEEDVDMSVAGNKSIELLFEEQMILSYEITVEQAPPASGDDEPDQPGNPSETEKPSGSESTTGGCGGFIGDFTVQATVLGVLGVFAAMLFVNRKRSEK